MLGEHLPDRVYGPELMLRYNHRCVERGLRVAAALQNILQRRIQILIDRLLEVGVNGARLTRNKTCAAPVDAAQNSQRLHQRCVFRVAGNALDHPVVLSDDLDSLLDHAHVLLHHFAAVLFGQFDLIDPHPEALRPRLSTAIPISV